MPDTIVHTAESAVDGTLTGLASAVGSLTNEAAHHAEALAGHAERLANIEQDTQWIRTRLDDLAQAASTAPATAIDDLRAEMAQLRNALADQAATLSEAIVPEVVTEEPATDPPPPQANEAQEKQNRGPLGGLRAALHRLL